MAHEILLAKSESWVAPLKVQETYHAILKELGLVWSYTSPTCDTALIFWLDKSAQAASRRVPNFYPPDVFDKLHNKATLSPYLSEFGFPLLRSRQINSFGEIGNETNFILKPQRNQGSVFSPQGREPLAYKKFASVDDLLAKFPQEAINKELANGYTIQQADMSPRQHQMIIRGTVNSDSDIYWMRSSTTENEGGKLMHSVKSWGGYDEQRALMQSFIKRVGVRNAWFNVIFLKMDEVYYPLDWHFRLGYYTSLQMCDNAKDEIKRAVAHQFDVPTDLPDVFGGEWVFEADHMRQAEKAPGEE